MHLKIRLAINVVEYDIVIPIRVANYNIKLKQMFLYCVKKYIHSASLRANYLQSESSAILLPYL